MKLPECVLAPLCLLNFVICFVAMSGIYAYTTTDNSVNQSNLPVDERYRQPVDPKETAGLSQPESELAHEPPPVTLIANKVHFDQMVAEVAHAHNIDGALLHAVISVESHYNPNAVSSKGAVGLMQLMPATAKRYGVSDSFDPAQNLNGGAKYLRDLLILFNSDINLALAAYNAGENAVIRNGNRIPPFRETRNYVPRVMGYYRQYQVKL